MAAIWAGSLAISASRPAMRESTTCRSMRALSCASTSASLSSVYADLDSASPLSEWAHLDSNQDRTGYEPGALPIELWARVSLMIAPSRFEEAAELLGARWMAQLAERLRLDLADALAGDGEVLPHLLERVLAAVGQPEAEAEDLFLARRQGVQDLVGLLAQRETDHALDGRAHLLVLDEVAEVAVLLLADRRLERDGLLRDLQHLAHL